MEQRLVDISNFLELGADGSESKKDRESLLLKLFSNTDNSDINYKDVSLCFVSIDEPRWSVQKIEWYVEESVIKGRIFISLGNNFFNKDKITDKLFVLYGCNDKVAGALAVRGFATKESEYVTLARNIIKSDQNFCEELEKEVVSLPVYLQAQFNQWKSNEPFIRIFSPEGMKFLIELLKFLWQSLQNLYKDLLVLGKTRYCI